MSEQEKCPRCGAEKDVARTADMQWAAPRGTDTSKMAVFPCGATVDRFGVFPESRPPACERSRRLAAERQLAASEARADKAEAEVERLRRLLRAYEGLVDEAIIAAAEEEACEHDWETITGGERCTKCGTASFQNVEDLIRDLHDTTADGPEPPSQTADALKPYGPCINGAAARREGGAE